MGKDSLIPLPKCTVTLTGATFDKSMTFEEWVEVGRKAVRVSQSVQWLIGDWLNFGWCKYVQQSVGVEDRVYGMKFRVALDSLPYEYGTLRNLSSICNSIELSRRRDKLSFKHHAEVSPYSPDLQTKYLDIAEKESLSVADLRDLIRKEHSNPLVSMEYQPHKSPSSWATKLSVWYPSQKPEEWPPERRNAWKRELAPSVDFYNRL